MIKRLRIQFVCAIMAIVMLMLAGILGVVIHFTAQNLQMQSESMMRTIAASPFQQGTLGRPSEDVRLPFFAVQLSSRGELIHVGGGYFDLSDGVYLRQIVDDALSTDDETGKLTQHNLRYLKTATPAGLTIVFADTSSEESTIRNLFYNCLLIFFAAGLAFFGISVLLSHRVIQPVENAWDQQRQFVADASHELKTPLSVIMANAELLQNEETTDDERTSFSRNILSMSYQMRTLVENLLEMARVDNGTLQMHFAPVDLSELVHDAVLCVQLLYEERGLELMSTIADGIIVNASEHHLYQVLDVLLDNALKYSTPNGCVCVALMQSGRSCTLSVSGPGEALSKQELKDIFKRFYRADKARTMNGSYGLGLSIAESVVHAHHGKIWAESGDGRNTFFVQLPICSGR